METILSHKKHVFGKDEFIVTEKANKAEVTVKFQSQEQLVDYLKDSTPLLNKNNDIVIDKNLEGNQRILLKHSSEKAKKFQQQHGFSEEAYVTKKDMFETIGAEDKNDDEKLSLIASTVQNNSNSMTNVMYQLLADYSIDIYSKLFGSSSEAADHISDKQLRELKTNFNLLISNNYSIHVRNEHEIDLTKLRNNLSRIAMKREHQTQKLIKNKNNS